MSLVRRLGVVLCCSGCGPVDSTSAFGGSQALGAKGQKIVNGDTVARGSLASMGIVRVSMGGGSCTGTLLTNQHVLTSAHCTTTPISVRLEGTSVALDQTVAASTVFVAPDWATNMHPIRDYAVLELEAPLVVAGDDDMFSNVIYPAADSTLVGATVFCAGYGNSVEGTWADPNPVHPGSGGGTLRSASLGVYSASGHLMQTERTNDQIQHKGDSGSTCFLDGFVTGVFANEVWESSTEDVNEDGFVNFVYGNLASPDAHRTFSEDLTLADVVVRLRTVPTVAGTYPIAAYTLRESWSVSLADGSASSRTAAAVRSGRVTLTAEEPERMMCEKVKRRAGLTDTVDLTMTCLGDGLVSLLL